MAGINKVILVGNLGNDPEIKYAPSGDAITNLSIATSESWKDKNSGEKKEKTEWHRVVLFGKKAELAGEYLRKGSKVYLEGKLQTRKWTDKEGQDRYTTEVVLQNYGGEMQFLDSRGGGGGEYSAPAAKPAAAQASSAAPAAAASAAPAMADDFDDDIPF